MRLAILYDWIDKWGGAERVLQTLFDAFPQADLYTIYTDYRGAEWAQQYKSRLKTTALQQFYRYIPFKSVLAPLMPVAVESLDLSQYHLVLSVSSSFIKGVITRPETKHICYLFTPTRFLWHERQAYYSNSLILRPFTTYLRNWDYIAGQRPDEIITLSEHSQKLIKKYYRRESEVVFPPFNGKHWKKVKQKSEVKSQKHSPKFRSIEKDFFLFVGRMEPYKRVDLLIEVFKKLKQRNLVILGQGTMRKDLKRASEGFDNIFFIDSVSEYELADLYQRATAVIMPQAEDFGYTALESIYFQTPVIAYKYSGVTEIVEHGKTGFLFDEQTPKAIATALEKFSTLSYNFSHLDWQKFSKKRFVKDIKKTIFK